MRKSLLIALAAVVFTAGQALAQPRQEQHRLEQQDAGKDPRREAQRQWRPERPKQRRELLRLCHPAASQLMRMA